VIPQPVLQGAVDVGLEERRRRGGISHIAGLGDQGEPGNLLGSIALDHPLPANGKAAGNGIGQRQEAADQLLAGGSGDRGHGWMAKDTRPRPTTQEWAN
jgi:hypothetical protein